MTLIFILCGIVNLWFGLSILSLQQGTLSLIVGIVFTLLGIYSFVLVIQMSDKKSKVEVAKANYYKSLNNNTQNHTIETNYIDSNQQHYNNYRKEKFCSAMDILEVYYKMGFDDLTDIEDLEERSIVKKMYIYCIEYKNEENRKMQLQEEEIYKRKVEYENALREEEENRNQLAGSVMAGVALGAIFSNAIYNKYKKDSEYMKERFGKGNKA